MVVSLLELTFFNSMQGCHIGRLEAIGRAGGPVHYVRYELDILYIISEYTLKILRIYSNILKYTRIFPCRAGVKVYRA
jgi:hypothetical protein